jgi:L-cysteine:1D-myo-inositol 2-amino-2-deoxy-alpha-D-glucopyranoside ligase
MSTSIRLYDTAAHQVVDWQPPREVRIYVCGITPYDAAHMGHIFTFMTYDLLQRYLEDQGHTVTMVRNVTDVDEPIFRKAAECGIPYRQLATQETTSFQAVLRQLNFRPASHEPLASDYIEHMAASVAQLVAHGVAYALDGDIYFDTAQDHQFDTFSGFSERLQLGLLTMRGGDPDRIGKRGPLDFMLWHAITDPADTAAWTTAAAPVVPRGRPGWHIECSVMSAELLGLPFDLHGGGSDLIFPHHAAEIAQNKALGSGDTAQHWLHVAPLDYCGEKMSKSLGNLVFARDLLANHEPSAIRLALMNYHYRIGGEWLPCLLQEAAELLIQLRVVITGGHVSRQVAIDFAAGVRAALANDLDTHAIMHALQDLATSSAVAKHVDTTARNLLENSFQLLGLSLHP